MSGKDFFKTLASMVAVVKVDTLAKKLANVEAKALVDTLANTLAEIQMQTLGYTLAEVEAKVLVDTLRDGIAGEVETFYNTVSKVKADVLVGKVARRIAVLSVKTLGHNLTEV